MANAEQVYLEELPNTASLAEVSERKVGYVEDSKSQAPSPLEGVDLHSFLGPNGTLARTMADFEERPGQLEMAELVRQAILQRRPALIEAPTGTGKSIAYLLPAVLSEQTVVIATANKSLQDQLYRNDIPLLSKVLDRPIEAVLVKGRNNYICTLKWEREAPQRRRIALLDKEDEQVDHVTEWLKSTTSGDVDDLPFVLKNDLRPRIVSFPDDCIGRDCVHFSDNCFVNQMRDRARQAQVIITNHHLLLNALELGEMGQAILPEAAVYVVDEAHQLENTATAVFEVETSDFSLEQLLSREVFKAHVDAESLDELRWRNRLAFSEVENLSEDRVFRVESELDEIKKVAGSLKRLQDEMRQAHPFQKAEDQGGPPPTVEESEEAANYDLAVKGLGSLAGKLQAVASSSGDDISIRYAEKVSGSRQIKLRLHAAPIDPARELSRHLFEEEGRTVICTSATLSTDGSFEHFRSRCGVVGKPLELIADAVFHYAEQALLYQPQLPAFNWRDRDPFYDAVAAEIERLLNVSRGRALCLFTSWSGLQLTHERLRGSVWPLQAQGDLPRNALLDWFRETPHSVLLATKSFWEGVDLPGDDLSLVVLDKLPFPTPSDPLHEARMKSLDEAEAGSSFRRYMLPLMTLALKQGFGRLIRRTADRGVVAILDERLSSKAYGRRARQDLPPAQFSRDFTNVNQFYREALASQADFSLNVFCETAGDPGAVRWRWQLARMRDGVADQAEGALVEGDSTDGEIHAATAGLENLSARVTNAGRDPRNFGVELRCSEEAALCLAAAGDESKNAALAQWATEREAWNSVDVIGLQTRRPA